jgi:hydrogenase maturation protein HypF
MGWQGFAARYGRLELHDFLHTQPRALLDAMQRGAVNSPLASSCGRLFDAVAAAAGICREQVLYEGQAAVEFEAVADGAVLRNGDDTDAYPFELAARIATELLVIEPTPMWHALLADLMRSTAVPIVSARFHKGLALAISRVIERLRDGPAEPRFQTVALSGGVFQNRLLLEQLLPRLESTGLRVLTHRLLPAHDGGLALGQAVVAAARALEVRH